MLSNHRHRHCWSLVSAATLTITVMITMLALPVGPAAAQQQAPVAPYIRSLTWAGSGCPAGSAAAKIAPDGRTATLTFTKYSAQAGPGIPITENRKNCNINLQVRAAGDCAVHGRVTAKYAGLVLLDPEVTALRQATYWESGNPGQQEFDSFAGPLERDWSATDVFDLEPRRDASARTANIHTQIRVNNANNKRGSGLITVDTIEFPLTVEETPLLQRLTCELGG